MLEMKVEVKIEDIEFDVSEFKGEFGFAVGVVFGREQMCCLQKYYQCVFKGRAGSLSWMFLFFVLMFCLIMGLSRKQIKNRLVIYFQILIMGLFYFVRIEEYQFVF